MRRDELQYLIDTILIEKLASDTELVKEAGLFEDIGFDSIASAIKGFAKEHVNSDNPGGIAGSIINLMAPAMLYRMHPILGVTVSAASALGFNIISLVKKIINPIKDKLNNGEPVDIGEINTAGHNAVSAEVGDLSSVDDMLEPVREVFAKLGKLPHTPWGYEKGVPLLKRIFGNISEARGRWLIGGIIVWVLKTLLVGAGLVGGAQVIKNIVSPTSDIDFSKQSPTKKDTEISNPISMEPFKASGNGQKVFKNDNNNVWIVPLINRSIDDTLIEWAKDVYPELSGLRDVIEDSPDFQKTVAKLTNNFNSRDPNNLIMPIGLHSRKQVVDLFAKDVKRLLKE